MPQQFERQSGRLILCILGDDLRKGDACQVTAGLGVDHTNFLAFTNERSQIVEVDVAAAGCVVQAAIPIFFDDDYGRLHGPDLCCHAQANQNILTQAP